MNPLVLYLPLLTLACSPWVSSAGALLLGLVACLGIGIPLPARLKRVAKMLLQGSIIALGFAMQPSAVVKAGLHGVGLTAATLLFTLGLAAVLARALRIPRRIGALIGVGTAICGGSAIAAMAPVLDADNDEMAVSLAVVFLLNAIALLVFPPIGHRLGMSPEAFGLFAAVAIHDTSSVVGAATAFAPAAVPIAVTVKLTRALWIVPLTFATALLVRRTSSKTGKAGAFPWFIIGFVVAVGIRAAFPDWTHFYHLSGELGQAGLKGAIFLISAQISRAALVRIGVRPLAFAVLLWGVVIAGTLALISSGMLTFGG